MVVNFDTTFYRSGINLFIRIIPLARAGPQFMTKVESGSDSGLSTPQEALQSSTSGGGSAVFSFRCLCLACNLL